VSAGDGVLHTRGELHRPHCAGAECGQAYGAGEAYSFTSAPIAKALLDAHKRGVQVQVILAKSQRPEKYSSADFLAHQGVPTMIDAEHATAHNKVMIIDGETVITGSFNFTKAAQEKNAENLLIIRDPAPAAQYTQDWEAHRPHSQPYVGRGVRCAARLSSTGRLLGFDHLIGGHIDMELMALPSFVDELHLT
jgi:phosphatidylserine/phosphatidylglycerophosphate/cardiolipin synthase-like enzyme